MKNIIAKVLTKVAEWCRIGLVAYPNKDIYNKTYILVDEVEKKFPKQSGEFKRHQVYAKLLKEFPDANKQDLGMAIEIAVRGI